MSKASATLEEVMPLEETQPYTEVTLPGSTVPVNSRPLPTRRRLGEHPVWPDFLAALAEIRQADRERDEREYAE